MKKLCCMFVILTMISLQTGPAFAQNSTWLNTGITSPSWSNSDNWAGGFIPGSTSVPNNTDVATFNSALANQNYGSSTTPITIDSNRNIGGISFDTAAGNYSIGTTTSGNSLLLTSGGTTSILSSLTATNAIETINAPLVIEGAGGTYTFSNNSANGVGAGAGTLDIGGGITGGAAGSTVLTLSGSNTNSNTSSGVIANGSATSVAVTKSGAGTWVLSGTNTYTGITTINAGTLVAANTAALGASTSPSALTLNGGTLDIATDASINSYKTTVTADSTIDSDRATSGAGVTQTLGTLQIGANTLNAAAGSNVTSGTAGLTFGAVTLTATGATFSAGSGALLTLGAISDGGSGYNFTVTGTGNTDITGIIGTETGTLTKSSTGVLTLSGTNTYSGITTINAGTVVASNVQALGTSSLATAVTMAGGMLDIATDTSINAYNTTVTGDSTIISDRATSGAGITQTLGTLAIGNETLGVGKGSNVTSGTAGLTFGAVTLSASGANFSAGSGTLLTLGSISDSSGTGYNFTVSGSGNTDITGIIGTGIGTLTQSGTGTLTLSGANTYTGMTTLNSGEIYLDAAETAGTSGPLGDSAASNPGSIVLNGGYLQYSALNQNDYSGRFSTAVAQQYNVDTNSQSVTWGTALISSGGELTKIGAGTLVLTAANTYTGATTISGGTLQIGNGGGTGSLGAGNVVDNANLTFDLNSASTTVSNTISGTGGVTQSGLGTIILSGSSNNSYNGATSVTSGKLQAGKANQAFGLGSAVSVSVGGTLDLGGYSEAIGSLSGAGAVTDTGSNAVLTVNGSNSPAAFSGTLDDGSGTITLDKTGTGTLTLSGTTNNYSGGTQLNNGMLDFASGSLGTGTVEFTGNSTLQWASGNTTDVSSSIKIDDGITATLDTQANIVTFNHAFQLGGSGTGAIIKNGSGNLILDHTNMYSGGTTVNAGTLTQGIAGALGASTGSITVNNTNTGAGDAVVLDLSGIATTTGSLLTDTIAAPSSGTNTATILNTASLTVNQTTNGNYEGVISGAGSFTLGGLSTNTLTLSGHNTYSGGTTISAGTLQVENPYALGTVGGVANSATLNLDQTNLTLGGEYTQNAGATLELTVANTGGLITSGNITAPSASLDAGSNIYVNTPYLPTQTSFTVINTGASVGAVPTTINSSSPVINFTASGSDGLTLTSTTTIAEAANNANGRAMGTTLDNITSPSSDMETVLSKLVNLPNDAAIGNALNTMGPVVDAGVVQSSSAALNNFIGASLDRIQSVLNRQNLINTSLNKVESYGYGTGISSGDELEQNNIWAKPYGSYLSQGTLQGIQGYNAWNGGTEVGIDRKLGDDFVVGLSGGYAYGEVNSDANNASTNISSAQGTIYGGFQSPDQNYYLDAAESFAWNWYDGKRDIAFDTINRTADASYTGQQYSTYVDTGYRIALGDMQLTPLGSLQWTHLSLENYTETGANSLDLKVNSQSYNTLESGLGVSLSLPQTCVWGLFTPEVHAKWLYDFINDKMSVTSAFTGGGASFTSNGATPGKEGVDLGGKLTFALLNDISLIAELDAELKDGFIGAYGSGTVQYKF